jgi:hypothetical protein
MYMHNPILLWSEKKAKGRIKHGGFWMGARGVCVCSSVIRSKHVEREWER